MIITLDGPSGSGKGTIAKKLSEKMQAWHLDSGLLYRALAFFMNNHPAQAIDIFIAECDVQWISETGETVVYFDKTCLNPYLRTEQVAQLASKIASDCTVREILLHKFRALALVHPNMIADGRDMGSVVFPQADLKCYIDAPVDVRAWRRYQDLLKNDAAIQYDDVFFQIEQRDNRDRNRPCGALCCPDKALVINTTKYSVESAVDYIMSQIQKNITC